jgi:ATP-dependent DNA helicase RecQ
LIGKNFLLKTDTEYPVIEITSHGRTFLEGNERLMLPQLRSASKTATKKSLTRPGVKTKMTPVRAKDTGVANNAVFEELRALRKQLAAARGVPPFAIFADSSLREMALRLPHDEMSFLAITGVGEVKLKKFGPLFLNKIKEARSKR